MNFQQLEYIIALDEHKHFRKAAEHCHVTQPTLSMMVKKLEEELGGSLFDRNQQPIVPTEVGQEVIRKAREAIQLVQEIPAVVHQHKGKLVGKLQIAIIPTLGPYLLPLFVHPMLNKFPELELQVKEMAAREIEEALELGQVDMGILVTPVNNKGLEEVPLFYEKIFAYISDSHPLHNKESINPNEIEKNQLWVLEEGHCFRNQVIRLCETRAGKMSFRYEAGNIETLKKLVDKNGGLTILPELACYDLDEQEHIRPFQSPEPIRQISLVTHRTSIKKQLVKVVKDEVTAVLPSAIKNRRSCGEVINTY